MEVSKLGEELPKLMAKIRDQFIPAYQSIGPSGAFAISMMRVDLDLATKALAERDVVGMIGSYKALSEYKL